MASSVNFFFFPWRWFFTWMNHYSYRQHQLDENLFLQCSFLIITVFLCCKTHKPSAISELLHMYWRWRQSFSVCPICKRRSPHEGHWKRSFIFLSNEAKCFLVLNISLCSLRWITGELASERLSCWKLDNCSLKPLFCSSKII